MVVLDPIVYVHHLVHVLQHKLDTIADVASVSNNDEYMSQHLVVLLAHFASRATVSLSPSLPLGLQVDL